MPRYYHYIHFLRAGGPIPRKFWGRQVLFRDEEGFHFVGRVDECGLAHERGFMRSVVQVMELPEYPIKECDWCGTKFSTNLSVKRFCSSGCNSRASGARARQREKEKALEMEG